MLRFRIDDLIGAPFRDGGRGPDAYDCWGLAKEIFTRAGYRNLPDYGISCDAAADISAHIDMERPRWQRIGVPTEPCLIAIRFNEVVFVNHCAVYIGRGQFIHTRKATGACLERLDNPAWRHRIEGFYVPKE